MLAFQIWTVAVGVLFFFLAWRTRRFSSKLLSLENLPAEFKLTPANDLADGEIWPKISVVIPACNEGETIESAMQSLLNIDYPNLEIILVNDRSNDKTGQIVDELSEIDSRIKPVHVHYLPENWLGKVNALERGLSQASADWILLTDADVHFAPDSLKNAVAYCIKDRLDFLTAIPDVVTKSSVLQIAIAQLFHQASLFFKPHRINDPKHRACYGQGAFMLMRKATYLRSERMQWLKMEVVDDTGLALLMRRAGARMGAVSGQNQIQIEWYPTFKAFIRGMEKNAFAFTQYSIPILIAATLFNFIIFGGFTVAPIMAGKIGLFTLASMVVYLICIRAQLTRMMRLKPWTVLAFPLAFIVLPFIFLRASLLTLKRGGVNWRGTFYTLENLKANQRMKLANLVFTAPPPVAEVVEELPKVSNETEPTKDIARLHS